MQVVNFIGGPLDGQVEFYEDNEYISQIEAPSYRKQSVHDLKKGTAYYEEVYATTVRYTLRVFMDGRKRYLFAAPASLTDDEVEDMIKGRR